LGGTTKTNNQLSATPSEDKNWGDSSKIMLAEKLWMKNRNGVQ